MATVLNVIGIENNNNVKIINNVGDMKKFSFDISGNSNLLQSLNSPDIQIMTMVFGGVKQKIEFKVPKGAVIFNSICNPDKSSKALKSLSMFMKQVPIPIINHPDNVLETTRDGVAKKLSSLDGLVVPKCIKIIPHSIKEVKQHIEKEVFPFPFIFRTSGDQGSQNMVKIDSFDDLERLECFAFTGENEFYMIEYVDYMSVDGYYRKMRYWIVGDKVIPRHLVIATSWNISYDIKKEMMGNKQELQKEEKQFMKNTHPDIIKKCLEIKEALKLDYFGIDCSIDEKGNMLVFEATPCMALLEDKNFPYINTAIPRIHRVTHDLILEKEQLNKLLQVLF